MAQRFRLSALVAQLGGELLGEDLEVAGIAPLDVADADSLAFVAQAKYRPLVAQSAAGAVVLKPEWASSTDKPKILTANPYAWFARAQALWYPLPQAQAGIHPSAVIEAGAEVDPTAEVGPFVFIGRGARVGARVVLRAGVNLGEGVTIGEDSLLYPGVTIYHQCRIGARCILHAGAVIGADGFGFAPENDQWTKIPQVGRVLIGDDVEIGANTTIDRGALADTVIANGVKLDNLIMLGHNVRVGEASAIAGCTGIAGSTVIGAHCTIGGAVMMNGHIEIADRTHIGGGAWVTKSLEGGKAYAGYPLSEAREWQKNAAHLRHLDEMAKTIKALQSRLEELERNKP